MNPNLPVNKYPPYPKYQSSGLNWLGEIPSNWEVKRFKWTIKKTINGAWGDEPLDNQNDLICVRVADFDRVKLRVNLSDSTVRNISKREQRGRILKKGDQLLEKSGGGDLQPVGIVVLFDHEEKCINSNFISRIQIKEDYDSNFLCFLHSSLYSNKINIRSIKQTTGIQNLDQNSYFCEPICIPPLFEQRTIATFLDKETEKIDGLISSYERLIKLLQEKRTALITHTVTRGLDPNVPLKDSGVEWVGLIPSHWKIKKIKYLSRIETGSTPPRDDLDNYSNGTISWVKPDDLNGHNPIINTTENISEKGFRMSRQIPKGSALVCCIGSVGKVGFAGCVCTTNQQINSVIFTKPEKWGSRYGLFSLIASDQEHKKMSNSVVISILNKNGQSIISFPIPPLTEQLKIATFLDHETEKIDMTINKIKLIMEKMREYRAALITAAVTGKIDVRGQIKENSQVQL